MVQQEPTITTLNEMIAPKFVKLLLPQVPPSSHVVQTICFGAPLIRRSFAWMSREFLGNCQEFLQPTTNCMGGTFQAEDHDFLGSFIQYSHSPYFQEKEKPVLEAGAISNSRRFLDRTRIPS